MATQLRSPTLKFQYDAIDMHPLDGEQLLGSNALEDNLLALLGHLPDPRTAIRRLLERLAGLEASARTEALAQLLVLAGLRRLHSLVREEIITCPLL
jgi:hypothetical protein